MFKWELCKVAVYGAAMLWALLKMEKAERRKDLSGLVYYGFMFLAVVICLAN